MTIQTIAFNGTNIETYGLGVAIADWLSIPVRTYQTVKLAGRVGVKPVSYTEDVSPRIITLRLLVRPTSYTDRKTKVDAIAALFNGPVSVTRVESPTLECIGLLEAIPITPHASTGQAFLYPDVFADMRVVCHDPLFYDITATAPATIAATAIGTFTRNTWRHPKCWMM